MKFLLILFGTFFMTTATLSAQESYEFSVETNSTYTDLTDSISINNGQIWDDFDSIPIPIGFDFVLFDDTVSALIFADDADLFNFINDSIANALFPYGNVDLVDRGTNTGTSLSSISYKTEGTAGSRIFKMEWRNAGFFDDNALTSFINFQVWLLEGSNEIQFHYGESNIISPDLIYFEDGPLVSVAKRLNLAQDGAPEEVILLSSSPSNPTLVTTVDANNGTAAHLGGTPANGTIYKFSHRATSTRDILENAHTLSIVPNPTSSVFNVELEDKDVKIETVSILNTSGQELLKTTQTQGIDVSKLNSGIYFVQINTQKGIATQRLVIE